MLWNSILCIFGFTNSGTMKYERVVRDGDGNDTGVREDERGAIYINHKAFFENKKTIAVIDRFSKSQIIIDIRKRRKKIKTK